MNTIPLDDRGCCAGVEAQTPVLIENRPGLSAIAYRCGTHSQFKQSLLAALSSRSHEKLRQLSTREEDDFTIALLDAWATTADILTFYQERIAQESYLRTATERFSLLQLGRLIGYELRPGVAASTYLAFTLETAAGAPRVATIEVGSKVQSVPGPDEKPQLFEAIEKIEARPEWNVIKPRSLRPQEISAAIQKIYFKGVATNLRKGDGLLVLDPALASAASWAFARVRAVTAAPVPEHTVVELETALTGFEPANPGMIEVYALRHRSGMFGHNAPDPRVLADKTRTRFGLAETDEEWNFVVAPGAVDLDGTYPAIPSGSWAVLLKPFLRRPAGGSTTGPSRTAIAGPTVAASGPAGFAARVDEILDIPSVTDPALVALCRVTATSEVGGADYALTAKVTRLSVAFTASPAISGSAAFGGQNLRQTTVYAQSEQLALADVPIADAVSGTQLELGGPVSGWKSGRTLAISGREAATKAVFSQVVTLLQPPPAGNFPVIEFTPAIPALERESVTVNANVVRATHGETVSEVLGDADASQAFQRFGLRQPPLTYVRAAAAGGAISTLQVRVNDLLWHQVASFYGHGPRERIYVCTTSDGGTTTVQFGDGIAGARPPTGSQNVRATYRRGIGLEGLVKAEQLSLLLTRPLGVKGVINPLASEGAADREQLSDARRNAPLTVLTLDRIVSLQDYEDFVRAFAGVAKSLATWTWDGEVRGVFVTVAGPAGAEIDMTGEFGQLLLAAIHEASVPGVSVRVKSYRPLAGLFTVSGRVKVDSNYESGPVLAAVSTALQAAFSFEARAFGEPVHLSEVIAVMQSIRGVVAVDVDVLRRVETPAATLFSPDRFSAALRAPRRPASLMGENVSSASSVLKRPLQPTTPAARIVAAIPQAGSGGAAVSPAELLVLAPLSANQIGVMA